MLPSADELLVEWVVIDVDHEAGRLLIVAADGRSWVGSHDIGIADPTVAGLKAIRCVPHAWIDADRVDPKWLTGRVVISRRLLTDGEYVIQLLSAAATDPVATYELQIRARAAQAF